MREGLTNGGTCARSRAVSVFYALLFALGRLMDLKEKEVDRMNEMNEQHEAVVRGRRAEMCVVYSRAHSRLLIPCGF